MGSIERMKGGRGVGETGESRGQPMICVKGLYTTVGLLNSGGQENTEGEEVTLLRRPVTEEEGRRAQTGLLQSRDDGGEGQEALSKVPASAFDSPLCGPFTMAVC